MTEEELVEKVARTIAVEDGWRKWDTAKDVNDTLNGNDPEDEREYYCTIARAAIAAMREAGAVFPAVVGPEPAVKTLTQEETAAAVFSVLNHPTRI